MKTIYVMLVISIALQFVSFVLPFVMPQEPGKAM